MKPPTAIEPLDRARFSNWLDLFRWVAAVVVVISHAGGILIVPLSDIPAAARTLPHFAFSFIAGFAHYAVMIFFVMSGYLVGGSFLRDLDEGRADILVYLSKRLARLYVVLLPTLALTVALMAAGRHFYPGPDGNGVYIASKMLASLDGGTLACNLAFLQNVACTRFGGNDALWSLTHEFWYYLAFPLLALGLYGQGSRPRRALLILSAFGLLLGLTLAQFSNAPIALYFAVWLLGVWAVVWRAPRRFANALGVAVVLLAVLVFARVVLGRTMQFGVSPTSWLIDGVVATLFALLLVTMKSVPRLPAPPMSGINKLFADASFSLYCIHFPVLLFLSSVSMAWLGYGRRTVPQTALQWFAVLAWIMLTMIIALAFAQATERHTNAVRTRLAAATQRWRRVPV